MMRGSSSSHSQTITTRNPIARKRATTLLSRSWFFCSLAAQNARLRFGSVAYVHAVWACQKHP